MCLALLQLTSFVVCIWFKWNSVISDYLLFDLVSTIVNDTRDKYQSPFPNMKMALLDTGIPNMNIRWSRNRLVLKMWYPFDSLAPGRFEWKFRKVIFKLILLIDGRGISWNWPQMSVIGPYWWWVNIVSGNGLVPSGNKSLPEPMFYLDMTSPDQNEISGNRWINPYT